MILVTLDGWQRGVAATPGLISTLVLGLLVAWAVARVRFDPTCASFPGVPPEDWNRALNVPDRGEVLLGRLEQALFFSALWAGFPTAIFAWLGFKLASKWAGWQHILKLPETTKPDPRDDDGTVKRFLIEFAARNKWGTWVVARFTLGSLFNVICAIAGLVVGETVLKMLALPAVVEWARMWHVGFTVAGGAPGKGFSPVATWFTVGGLGLTLLGALAAARGTLPPGQLIVAKDSDPFQVQQQRLMTWIRSGLLLISGGTLLQIAGTLFY